MITRRNFLKTTGLATAGLALNGVSELRSMTASSAARIVGANRKINLACVGIGNRGAEIINDFDRTGLANFVALCDVDLGARHTQATINKFPNAKQFRDFREMFDKMGNEIEAVSIAIPDFSHFPVAMLAMSLGKHVYVEKPMARTFYEVELMIEAAKKHKNVVTQVGNQGHSEANYFQFKAWKEAGIIKDVTEVTAHMNDSGRRWYPWDSKMSRYPDAQPVPPTMDWDLWLTTAMHHGFNEKYHTWTWRGWYDFGMGVLGDWAAHIIDTIHEFLELGLPYEVNQLKVEGLNDYIFPKASTLLFRFPKRGKMPPLDLTWYEGANNLPTVPEGYGTTELDPNIPPMTGQTRWQPAKLNPGKIIYSKDLIFKGGSHASTLSIIPEKKAKEMESKLPPVPKSPSNHFANFLLACQGMEKTRSPFEIHGPMCQMFSLGVIAQRLNTKILFDRNTRKITNNAFANAMLVGMPPRKGWEEFYKL